MPQFFDPNEQMKLLSQAALANPQNDQFNFESRGQAIEARKLALAAAMKRKAAMATPDMPDGKMVGGHYVAPHWTEMLSAALQPVNAQWDASRQEKELQKQTDEYSKADEIAAAAHQARMPASKRVQTDQELYGPTEDEQPLMGSQTVQPTSQEKMKWAQEGARIPSRKELLSKYVDDLLIKEPEREETRQFRKDESAATRTFKHEEGEANRAQRDQEMKQRSEDAKELQRGRDATAEQARQDRFTLAREGRADRRSIIEAQFEAREKAASDKVEAKKQEKVEKRAGDARDVIGLLDEAEKHLKNATSSGVGAKFDEALGWVGGSTKGSQATASLRTIGGQLVSKMPRMEGPQSDKDVQMYKDMAGKLDDPTTPYGDRKAALDQIRSLNEKYTQTGGADGSWDDSRSGPKLDLKDPASALSQLGRIKDPAERQAVITQFNRQYGPVKVNSIEQARQLPAGTKFVTPDGRIKVR